VCFDGNVASQLLSEFPFFHAVYKIAFGGEDPARITHLEKPVFVAEPAPLSPSASPVPMSPGGKL
jgi:hypothetical protein